MTAAKQVLMDKLKELPPERIAQVEDFIDFLRARDVEQRHTHSGTESGVGGLDQVRNNDDDAAYDRL